MTSYTSETNTPDRLFAGVSPRPVGQGCTVVSGTGALKRGTLLGKITLGAITEGTHVKTGNGTIGTLSVRAGAKVGTYTITCVAAATDGGRFQVVDPDGYRLADALVGTAYTDQIGFTIADGTSDFVVGDKFLLAVAAGSGKLKACDKDNTDGSQRACGILAEDIDATSADVVTSQYTAGEFNENAVIYASGEDGDTHRSELRALGIVLRSPVKA